MCIILTCEQQVRPDFNLISTCFNNNPDGAGIMWCEDGRVQTAKGFTNEWDLMDAIDAVPYESRLVIHMRIATSGGIDVGTCHPFPVCDDLDILHAQYTECDVAVMHNGVISGMPTNKKLGISDTVSFVSNVVSALYEDAGYRVTKSLQNQMKRAAPGNRFAIMTCDGKVYRIGSGWETVTKGLQASNSSWRYELLYDWDFENEHYEFDQRGYAYDDFESIRDSYDPEYARIFELNCDGCKHIGTCMSYGPICSYVSDLIYEWEMGELVGAGNRW